MSKRRMLARLCLPLVLFASDRSEANWPQFRGPTGQGHADATELPIRWSETENIVWKTAIPGAGWSSPVFFDDQVWITTSLDGGRSLRAIGVDPKNGSITHDVDVFGAVDPVPINPTNTHASPTPVVESDRVYVHFGAMGTACLSTETGKVLWVNRELMIDHKEGPGSSPIPYRDLLIVHYDGMDAQYVAALRKEDGTIAWKTTRTGALPDNPDFRKAYATPLVIRVDGVDQLISPGASRVMSYDPRNGTEFWRVDYFRGFSNVPRPVFGNGMVYVCSDYANARFLAIRPDGKGNVSESHVAWSFAVRAPVIPSPIFVEDRLYVVSNRGILSCLDAQSGKVVWKKRLEGEFSASPIFADGRLYWCNREGSTFVHRPGDEWRPEAVSRLDGRLIASPAVIGAALILRTDSHLYRIEKPSISKTARRSISPKPPSRTGTDKP